MLVRNTIDRIENIIGKLSTNRSAFSLFLLAQDPRFDDSTGTWDIVGFFSFNFIVLHRVFSFGNISQKVARRQPIQHK